MNNPFALQEIEHKEKFGLSPSVYFAMLVTKQNVERGEMIKMFVDDVQNFEKHYVVLKSGFLPIIAKRNEIIDIDLSIESIV